MARTSIIQLFGQDGQPQALFAFDPEMMSEEQAKNTVDNAVEAAFQVEEDLGEDAPDTVLNMAIETLENLAIFRVTAAEVTTDRL